MPETRTDPALAELADPLADVRAFEEEGDTAQAADARARAWALAERLGILLESPPCVAFTRR